MAYDIEKIREVFKKDKFLSDTCGITIEEVTEEYVLLKMDVQEKHMNELGSVQGGAIFTLGDSAFAVVCNLRALKTKNTTDTVSRNGFITFLKPAICKTLYAKGKVLSEGKKTSFCEIDIFNENDIKIAHFIGDGFRL